MARSCSQQFSLPVNAPRRVRGVVGVSPYAGLMTDAPEPTAVRRPALSPSRAADFKQCPLLYRFRAIDRLPEPSSTAQVRGSVVHAALEQLYALPAAERGPRHRDDARRPGVGAPGGRSARTLPTSSSPRCGPNSSMRRAHCCPATTDWRTQPGSIRRAASSASRSNSRTAPCCAASSTASMSRPPGSCGSSTTRPARLRPRRGHWPNSRPCSR